MDCATVQTILEFILQCFLLSLATPCREPSIRLLYIDDALIATTIKLDREAVPLLPTYGPVGRMGSCNLGIPGDWINLQHRLRDVKMDAESIGMQLNEKEKLI